MTAKTKSEEQEADVFEIILNDKSEIRARFTRDNGDGVSQIELWGPINGLGYQSYQLDTICLDDEAEIKRKAAELAEDLRRDFLAECPAGEDTEEPANESKPNKSRKKKAGKKSAKKREPEVGGEKETEQLVVETEEAPAPAAVSDPHAEAATDADPAAEQDVESAVDLDTDTVAENAATEAESAEESVEQDAEGPADDEQKNIVIRNYDKYLKCFLTEEQKQNAAADLVQRMEELKRKEDELTSIKNQFKGEIARLEAEIDTKANLVRDGYEFRDVAVRETKNYEDETLTIDRLDTFEQVEQRRLSASELQRTLPGMA